MAVQNALSGITSGKCSCGSVYAVLPVLGALGISDNHTRGKQAYEAPRPIREDVVGDSTEQPPTPNLSMRNIAVPPIMRYPPNQFNAMNNLKEIKG